MKKRKSVLIGLVIILVFYGVLPNTSLVLESLAKNENKQMKHETEWNQSYGGSKHDWAKALILTTDGNFVFAGGTSSFGAGRTDMWLVKTDENGVALWNQTYGGPSDDWANALFQTMDGGFILAGCTQSFGSGGGDMWLVKTDASGVIQWNQTYGGKFFDSALILIQTMDGGYVLAGLTYSLGAGEKDMWLVKTDVNGAILWNHTFGGSKDDWCNDLLQTTDGSLMLVGCTQSFSLGESDMWLVKTDVNGFLQWNQTYGGSMDECADALLQTFDGGFVLAGFTRSYGDLLGRDAWLVKTDGNGIIQWNQTYGGIGFDDTDALLQTSDGGFVLAGSTVSFGNGGVDIWLVKTDAYGILQWDQTFGGSKHEVTSAFIQTSDGGFLIAGARALLYNKLPGKSGALPDHWIIMDEQDMWVVKTELKSGANSGLEIFPILVAMIALSCLLKRRK